MDAFADQLPLVVAGAALLAAASRVASQHLEGIERGLAAIVIAATVAVIASLGLGVAGLGSNRVALVAAALAAYGLSRLVLGPPAGSLLSDASKAARGLGLGGRIALGAVVGAALAWAATGLATPRPDVDSLAYHLPEVAAWIEAGTPGSVEALNEVYAVGSYPRTHEVLLAWVGGLSRSLGALGLLTPLFMTLLAVASWTTVRRLGVPRGVAALAVAAVCLVPTSVAQVTSSSFGTDLPAAAWLATAAALLACGLASGAASALPFAILAVGLAVGTKTTAALPGLAMLIAAGWLWRSRLAALRPWLVTAVLAAAVAGGAWYAANAIEHGSPLWPFMATPWGDALPPIYELLDQRFIQHPLTSLDGNLDGYAQQLGGGALLIALALIAPLLARRRAVVVAAIATAVLLLAWMSAPFTAVVDLPVYKGLLLSTARYLLPTVLAAVLTVALVSRDPGRRRTAAGAGLAAAVVLSLYYDLRDNGVGDDPALPLAAIAIGGAVGALLGLAASASRLTLGERPARPVSVALATTAALATAAALALSSAGYAERYEAHNPDRGPLLSWFRAEPGYAGTEVGVSFWGEQNGLLAGERFEHRLSLISAREGCDEVVERLRSDYLVLRVIPGVVDPPASATCLDHVQPALQDPASGFRVFAPRG